MRAMCVRAMRERADALRASWLKLSATCGLALALAACGTVGNVVDNVTGRGGQTQVAASDVAGGAGAPANTVGAGAPGNPFFGGGGGIACPAVQIREGTQGVTRYAGGRDESASAVRHQFSIVRTARDCRFVNGTLFLRVGVAGRVVLGPSGAAGTFSEPIRFVVARGGVEPVYSEVRTVQVSVPGGAPSAEFDLVDSDIQIQVRPDETVGNFQIFVGFDA